MRRCFNVLVLLLLVAALPLRTAAAREICFPGSPATACLSDPFADYWESNGGLGVFGYPLGAAEMRHSPDSGADLLNQWTERARLEAHPENQAPYTLLMGRLGAERLAQLGRDPAQEGRESGPLAECLWFEQTGHNVCDQVPGAGFKTYWQSHGLKIPGLSAALQSLQLFGLPLTAARTETNSSGDTVLTQWFERARFEWHPDKPAEYRVLLGLLGREVADTRSDTSVFGLEINVGSVGATLSQAAASGAGWLRYNGISWAAVEPSPGTRSWEAVGTADAEIQQISARGLTPIVVVRGTPGWARQVPGSDCGPIKPEALDAFTSFMRDLVARYSQPPFRVRYWEIWNEPDAPISNAHSVPFGCWGVTGDQFYGGGYFAEMLKRVYPAIKQADPAAQVVLGGLLLDCDPAHPPSGKECRSARFLEGILQNGGGAAFDILAYHAYAYWQPIDREWDLSIGNWASGGGAVLGKLAFLRDVLARYQLAKPIMLDEAGLLCRPGCPRQQYDSDQANYVIRLYTRAVAQQLRGVIWFTLNGPGWRDSGLLDQAQAPRPGYQAYTFLARLLNGAQYAGTFSNGALEGYVFHVGATTYRICWTNDGSVVTVPLPPATSALYDKLGARRAPAGPSEDVGHEPVIIESGS